MAGYRIFHSVVLMGLSLGGCNSKNAGVTSPGRSGEAEQPAQSPDAANREPQTDDGDAAKPPTEDAPGQPLDNTKSVTEAPTDEKCPEGSDMPDPPCFHIL